MLLGGAEADEHAVLSERRNLVTDAFFCLRGRGADCLAELFERGARTTIIEALARSGFMFFKSYLLQQGFRDGFNGLLIGYYSAVHVFTKYVKLMKLCRTQQN